MAETPNSQGDKARRPRPFGSFLLFLTILVVVLFAFGGQHLGGPTKLSQDEFWWHLYTGGVARLELKGENEITGELRAGERFVTSFAGLADQEPRIQQIHAIGSYLTIPADTLEIATAAGLIHPEVLRHLTRIERLTQQSTSSDGAEFEQTLLEQEDRLLVGATVAPATEWAGHPDVERSSSGLGLPSQGGRVWFRLDENADIGSVKSSLASIAPVYEHHSFDTSLGVTHGRADATFGLILLTWGPWILIFGVFLLFMRQMRNQGSGAGVMSFGRSRAQLYSKESHTNVTFDDVAGALEAKEEVREVVEFLKNPGRFTRIGGRIPRGVMLVGPPAAARPSWPRRSRGRRRCPSSRSPAPTSSRCSWGSAPAACATSSSRRATTPPASSSWTRSTPSAAGAARGWAGVTTSASRHSTPSWWRWTASAPTRGSSWWPPPTAPTCSIPPSCGRGASTAR